MSHTNQITANQMSHQKFQTYSDIDVGYNSSGGLTPPRDYDFGFIPGSPVSSNGSCNKTVSSDNDNSTSLSLHDVALEAELAMLQHAYSGEGSSQDHSRSSGTPSTVSISPSDSASNLEYFQHPTHVHQQHLVQQQQWQQMAWRNTLATANLMNLQSQVHNVMGQETQTQAALGLLYDYYQHQQPIRKQQYQQQQPQSVQPVVQKPTSKSVVSVKSEPLDNFDVAQSTGNKIEKLTGNKPEVIMTPTEIKKEPMSNSGLPDSYKGEYFEYSMEAPKSLKQKEGEPTMSYINKGNIFCQWFQIKNDDVIDAV